MPFCRAVTNCMDEMPVPGESRAASWTGWRVTRAISSTPVQAVVVPEHGIVLVEVPAPAQLHLGAAVDDLPVGKVGVLLALHQRPGIRPG